MWVWHVPVMYQAALKHSFIHVLEHLTFAAVGLLYWWHLLSPIRSRMRLGGLGPVLYMASTKIAVGLLGIVLAFSPDVLYDFYETRRAPAGGSQPLDDQHVAGVLMALEQSLVMGVALAYLFIRMLAGVRGGGPARRALRRGVGLALGQHPQVPARAPRQRDRHHGRAAQRDDVEQRQPEHRHLGAQTRPPTSSAISASRASVGPSRP